MSAVKIAAQRQTRINSSIPAAATALSSSSLSPLSGLMNGLSHDLEVNSYLAKIGYYRALSRVLYFGYDGLGDFDDVDTSVSDAKEATSTDGIESPTGKSKPKKLHEKKKMKSESNDKGVLSIVSHLVYALRDKFGLDRIGKMELVHANDSPIAPSHHAKSFPSSSSRSLFLGSSEKSGAKNTKSAHDSILKDEKKEVMVTKGTTLNSDDLSLLPNYYTRFTITLSSFPHLPSPLSINRWLKMCYAQFLALASLIIAHCFNNIMVVLEPSATRVKVEVLMKVEVSMYTLKNLFRLIPCHHHHHHHHHRQS